MTYLISGHEGWLGGKFVSLCENSGLKYATFNGDLCDEKNLQLSIDDDVVIVHFAGWKNNAKDECVRNNIIATSQLVRLAMSIQCKHFIYVSSISVVGPSNGTINKLTTCRPNSYYGKSKLICERIVSEFLDSYTIVRPTNIVDGNRVGVLALIYKSLINCSSYEVWEQSYNAKRDYISVEDVLDAILNIAKECITKNKNKDIINLGSGDSYSMREILNLIEKKIQAKIETTIVSNENFVSYDLIVDNSDTQKILGKKPKSLDFIIDQCLWVAESD